MNGVRIEQHLVTLRRVGSNDERPTGTKLRAKRASSATLANDQMLFAPVKLKGFAQLEWMGTKPC
ncbi:hypothetical protein MASR1M42_22510 [Azonexus hydrophilus]